MSEVDAYKLADELYLAGYNDRRYEKDYDPRGTDQWENVVNAIEKSAPVPPLYQLVPITPTPEMLKEIDLITGFSEKALTVRYSALLAAAPKPAPIEVTDELLIDLYDHSHDDEWVGQDVSTEALRRIVQRAFKHVGLEVKS